MHRRDSSLDMANRHPLVLATWLEYGCGIAFGDCCRGISRTLGPFWIAPGLEGVVPSAFQAPSKRGELKGIDTSDAR